VNLEDRKQELRVLREAYRRLFRTSDGQVVIADLVQRFVETGRNLRPADGAPLDPSQAVWNEGTRAPVRWITSMVKGEPDE
jgi:hypothetical protein